MHPLRACQADLLYTHSERVFLHSCSLATYMHLCQTLFNASALLLQRHAANATWPFATAASAAGALFLAGPRRVLALLRSEHLPQDVDPLGQTVEDS